MRTHTIQKCLVCAVMTALLVVITGCDSGPPRLGDANILKQLGLAFKAYSNESRGEKWPPRGTGPDAFCPEMKALAPYLGDDPALLDYLSGKSGPEICYLGHMLMTESMGLDLLDTYANQGPSKTRDIDVHLDHTRIHKEQSQLPAYRLRAGIERFLITEIGNPAGSAMAQAEIPTLWEMPQDTGRPDRDGGWVLFMDGHVEWIPFPGRFPMTEEFIKRLREMRNLPESEWKALGP